MLNPDTRAALDHKREVKHGWSFLKVFHPLLILSPIFSGLPVYKFENGTIKYRDIYVLGFRVIRWQI